MYSYHVCEYSWSEYEYKNEIIAYEYEYNYKYLKFVLEYYSSMSTSTKYYNSGVLQDPFLGSIPVILYTVACQKHGFLNHLYADDSY